MIDVAHDDSQPGRRAILPALQENIDRYLTSEIEIGSFPGAVYAIGDSSGVVLENAVGSSTVKPARMRAHAGTIYDVASLTKPLITSTLLLRAVAEGKIDLSDKVSKHLVELRDTDKQELTFIDLLSHRGGFQAWYPLYTQGMGDRNYIRALAKRPLRYERGTREIYTCLGFITLYLALERVFKARGEDLAKQFIFEPLGITTATFSPPPEMKYTIAATEWGNANERKMVADRKLPFKHFRNYMIWGEVNDGNAYYMGGMAGNAGLFATARDVFTIARAYLTKEEALLPAKLIEMSARNYTVGLEENRGLGWQLPSSKPEGPAAMLSEGSFGHTGFTGTSVWVDPSRDLIMVLLTNRVHPQVQRLNMQGVRRKFHLAVVEAWDSVK